MTRTSCPGCGAPIAGWRCEYCGREHARTHIVSSPLTNVAQGYLEMGMAGSYNVIDEYRTSMEMRNAMLAICMAGHRQPWKK